jgi:hypothetical protein
MFFCSFVLPKPFKLCAKLGVRIGLPGLFQAWGMSQCDRTTELLLVYKDATSTPTGDLR